MFNKLSIKTLLIIFSVLLFFVIYFFLFKGNKNDRTFRSELVAVDTSKVDEIYLYPKSENHSEVYLKKENDKWKVKIDENKFASVPSSKIKNLFTQLLTIKPKRLASRNEESWNDYQVDSSGTRVKIFEDEEKTLDIILGRFSFQQPRSMSTFIRLNDDTDVYQVDGFLDITFNQSAASFRNNEIVNSNKNDWQSLTFVYPADSSFRMENKNGSWFIDDATTDSASVDKYLNKLSRLNHTEFENSLTKDRLSNPEYSLKIDSKNSTSILVNGYFLEGNFYITSSQNEETIFRADSTLRTNIFVSRESFLK